MEILLPCSRRFIIEHSEVFSVCIFSPAYSGHDLSFSIINKKKAIKVAIIALTIHTHQASLYPHLPLYMAATCQRFMGYLHLMPALLLPDYLMSREFFKKKCVSISLSFRNSIVFPQTSCQHCFFCRCSASQGKLVSCVIHSSRAMLCCKCVKLALLENATNTGRGRERGDKQFCIYT